MSREVEAAVEAARAAGAVLRRGYGESKTIRYKAAIDLVTAFDEESERTIIQILSAAFPAYGFWTEESGHHAAAGDARWIVDPLDGTTNYAHDLPHFAVSIALEEAGTIVAGVVYDPMLDELFVAERGGAATLNGRPIRVSATEDLLHALLATGPPSDRSPVLAQRDYNAGLAVLAQGLRQTGSAALDLCYVAAGRLDAYFERGMHLWDIGAGMVIVAAAGGRVSTYAGTDCDQGTDDIVASNGLLHPALLDLLTERGGNPAAAARD
jgi:myo-inositol-1(or 4)-monophosphatase